METKTQTPTLPAKNEFKLPTLQEIFEDSIELAGKHEGLNAILNTPPPAKWIKAHPYIKVKDDHGNQVPYQYLPVDKVEYLLLKIFKFWYPEITVAIKQKLKEENEMYANLDRENMGREMAMWMREHHPESVVKFYEHYNAKFKKPCDGF